MTREWPVATCIQCVIVSSLINPLVYHGHHHNPPEFSLVYHSHEGWMMKTSWLVRLWPRCHHGHERPLWFAAVGVGVSTATPWWCYHRWHWPVFHGHEGWTRHSWPRLCVEMLTDRRGSVGPTSSRCDLQPRWVLHRQINEPILFNQHAHSTDMLTLNN